MLRINEDGAQIKQDTCLDPGDVGKQSKGTTTRLHTCYPSTARAGLTHVKLNIVVFHDSVDNSEMSTYSTKINDTFIDVLQNLFREPPDEVCGKACGHVDATVRCVPDVLCELRG